MNDSTWPKTLDEAVKICLLTLTPQQKELIKNTPREELTLFHSGWALNMRNEFGLWQSNKELLKSCGAIHPDEASMAIVEAVWDRLKR